MRSNGGSRLTRILARLVHAVASSPGRMVRAVPWAHMGMAGLGVGKEHTEDLDELETKRRQRRERWRRGEDEPES